MWTIEELQIWKDSISLAKSVYLTILNNNKLKHDFGLRDQIQRCAISIPSNIAEWYNRWSDKEFLRFLYISRWSIWELKTQLLICNEIWYLSNEELDNIFKDLIKIHKMLNWFINRINKDLNN